MGSFLDHALCLEQHTCAPGDDLLVLDRTTGLVQQYVFSFGNQYGMFDSRSQAFLREGILGTQQMQPVDASLFDLLAALPTGIHQEELYEARSEIMCVKRHDLNTWPNCNRCTHSALSLYPERRDGCLVPPVGPDDR